MPMRRGDEMVFVVVLQRLMARELVRLADRYSHANSRMRIASATDFDTFLMHRTTKLAQDAALGLRDRYPMLSAAPRPLVRPGWTRCTRFAACFALAGLLTLPTSFAIWLWSQMLALWFVLAIGLRVAAAFAPYPRLRPITRLPDAALPVYTVIVALYREARCVDRLLRALDALDYPREKLDIILAVEADDPETRDAISRFGAMPHLRVIVAPDIGPRTKPKALNCALQFARGSFIAVFDAEDRPDPGQLRAAL